MFAGCLVWRRVGWGSRWMVTHTSTWFWSATSQVQEMFMQSRSKGRKQGGNPCQGTGAKTGRAIHTLMVKPFLFKSRPVMVKPSLATTWRRLIGNLVKPSKGVSSRGLYIHTILYILCWKRQYNNIYIYII